MDIKVGDIVEYDGMIGRIMSVFPHRVKLSHIGMLTTGMTGENLSKLKLVESVKFPDINIGDFVRVQDIPSEEKEKYTFRWGPRRQSYVESGQPYEVLKVAYDENYGTCINLDGVWFILYHLEVCNYYDIV